LFPSSTKTLKAVKSRIALAQAMLESSAATRGDELGSVSRWYEGADGNLWRVSTKEHSALGLVVVAGKEFFLGLHRESVSGLLGNCYFHVRCCMRWIKDRSQLPLRPLTRLSDTLDDAFRVLLVTIAVASVAHRSTQKTVEHSMKCQPLPRKELSFT